MIRRLLLLLFFFLQIVVIFLFSFNCLTSISVRARPRFNAYLYITLFYLLFFMYTVKREYIVRTPKYVRARACGVLFFERNTNVFYYM